MGLYHTTDTNGVSEIHPDETRMRAMIARLDEPDAAEAEYPDVSLVHDATGWSLSLFPSGIVVFENLDETGEDPRYLTGIRRERAFRLWRQLAAGEIGRLLALPWRREANRNT